jgi:hypothetical protein
MGTGAKMEKVIRVADEAWVGLALLQKEHPERESFSAKEILERVKSEAATAELRPGVQVHIYLHNVANLPPNSARYRMFYRLPGDGYRLFRTGDRAHPLRHGKSKPEREELPERYHSLLDWYEQKYSKETIMREEDDPILQMRGVGKEIWKDTNADEYVRDLRSNWFGEEREER